MTNVFIASHVHAHMNAQPALKEAVQEALKTVSLPEQFGIITIETKVTGLTSDLIEIQPGMKLGWGNRKGRDILSRAVECDPAPTDKITLIFYATDHAVETEEKTEKGAADKNPDIVGAVEEGCSHILITAYAGESSPREANNPLATEEDKKWWETHALAYPSASWENVAWDKSVWDVITAEYHSLKSEWGKDAEGDKQYASWLIDTANRIMTVASTEPATYLALPTPLLPLVQDYLGYYREWRKCFDPNATKRQKNSKDFYDLKLYEIMSAVQDILKELFPANLYVFDTAAISAALLERGYELTSEEEDEKIFTSYGEISCLWDEYRVSTHHVTWCNDDCHSTEFKNLEEVMASL